jgi:membrane-associated phospholipid phosphatase
MSFMLIPLLILVRERKWNDPVKIIVTFLVVGWALFVGLSRIVVGAHYASDVLFAAGMAVLISIILYKKIYNE